MSASSWYENSTASAAIPPQVAERALEWLVELQEQPVPPELVSQWRHWLSAHPDHERAWQRIEAINNRLQPLTVPAHAAMAQAVLTAPNPARRRQLAKALLLPLLVGSSVWGAVEYTPWREWGADQHTDVGQRRTLVLADGTQLVLNTNSAVNVQFSAQERRIRLLKGEILATTAKDALARPFLIETAHGTAQALGTRYVVRQLAQSTAVSVYQGAVRIRPNQADGQTLVLQAGQQARFRAHGIEMTAPVDTASVDWSDGFIVARSMRLDDFIAELGRYSKATISCDPRVSSLRVSGSFPLDDVDKVVDTLAATLDLQVDSAQHFWGSKRLRLLPAPAWRASQAS